MAAFRVYGRDDLSRAVDEGRRRGFHLLSAPLRPAHHHIDLPTVGARNRPAARANPPYQSACFGLLLARLILHNKPGRAHGPRAQRLSRARSGTSLGKESFCLSTDHVFTEPPVDCLTKNVYARSANAIQHVLGIRLLASNDLHGYLTRDSTTHEI
jgi:hypothetical protein